jgi:hypothetical protein
MGMTCAGRRVMVGCVVAAIASSVSACKVLPRAESASASSASITAAADGLDPAAAGDAATCLFSADDVSEVFGGRWTVSSLPSGGCNYSQNNRSILVSEVPLPKDARGRHAALVQTRKPCDAGSAQSVASLPDAFVCRQGTLLEAATIAAGRLVVVCTEAGSDPAAVPGARAALGALLARAG